jgi:Transglutaminase-like superfamily
MTPARFLKVSSGRVLSSSPKALALTRRPPPLLLFRLAVVAMATPLLMRAGLPRLHRWIEPGQKPTPIDSYESGPLEDQMGRWVDSIIRRGQPLVRPGCLTRGVTLYYALRRAGDDVSLCFGVGSDQGQPAGHCWLDKDGQPLLELVDPLSKFTEVVRLTPDGVIH